MQPINLEAALAVFAAVPTTMMSSVRSDAEAYESDPARLARVRQAAGYDRELWRLRYRQEALCGSGVHFRIC